jgi:hypothetical protein
MAKANKALPKIRRAPDPITDLATDLADLVRGLKRLFDPYRPELHYMRGPGPAWHAKHDDDAVPAGHGLAPSILQVR